MTAHTGINEPAPATAHVAGVHVVPLKVLFGIWGTLLALTFVTVAVTWFDLGPFNLWVALGIAVVKAGLVALYFMHLRYDSPFNGFLLIGALAFVMLLAGVALTDSHQYEDQLIPGYAPAIKK